MTNMKLFLLIEFCVSKPKEEWKRCLLVLLVDISLLVCLMGQLCKLHRLLGVHMALEEFPTIKKKSSKREVFPAYIISPIIARH